MPVPCLWPVIWCLWPGRGLYTALVEWRRSSLHNGLWAFLTNCPYQQTVFEHVLHYMCIYFIINYIHILPYQWILHLVKHAKKKKRKRKKRDKKTKQNKILPSSSHAPVSPMHTLRRQLHRSSCKFLYLFAFSWAVFLDALSAFLSCLPSLFTRIWQSSFHMFCILPDIIERT